MGTERATRRFPAANPPPCVVSAVATLPRFQARLLSLEHIFLNGRRTACVAALTSAGLITLPSWGPSGLRLWQFISSLPHWVWPCTSQHWIALLRLKTTRKRERPNPATRSIRYVPTTCHVVNRRRPDNKALAAAARRAGLDPRAARVGAKPRWPGLTRPIELD